MLQARELFGRSFECQWYRCAVLQVGRVHLGFEHQPERIHQ
jgi:hypothetical protein